MGNKCSSNMSSSPSFTRKKHFLIGSSSFSTNINGMDGSLTATMSPQQRPNNMFDNEILKKSSSTSTGFGRRNGYYNGSVCGDDALTQSSSPEASRFTYPASYDSAFDEPFLLGRQDSFGLHPEFSEVRASFSTKRRRSSLELGLG
jgi:hypothetical protein